MPNTASLSEQQKQLWANEALIEAIEEMFFKQFMSEKGNGPVHVKNDFTKKKGYRMNIKLVKKLDGEGRDGDDEMEGNEEDLDQYNFTFDINQKRNAVRLKGRMDELKAATSLRKEAKSVLGMWLSEIMEKECFRKLGGLTSYTFSNTPTVPSANRVIYGGNAASDSDIDASDVMTLELLFKIGSKVPSMTPLIKPVRYKGKNYYIFIIHPRQRFQLLKNSDYVTLMKDAHVRGKDNPLFSGADAIVDNLVIHVHNYVPTFSTWGAGGNLPGARGLVLGAQALALGFGKASGWDEEKFDYGNKWAICTGRIFGLQKLQFNGEDYGVVAVDTYAAAL